MLRSVRLPIALLLLAAFALPALAADASGRKPSRLYGKGAPFTEEDLPPGQLRDRLKALAPHARARGMNWLHSFSFPAQDVDRLRLDEEGGVYYVEPGAPEPVAAAGADDGGAVTAEALGAAEVMRLHSRPGAARIIHIDFDGAVVSGTAWNSSAGVASWDAPPFDLDGLPSSFNATEVARIHEIWHRVAEDYSAFDVDVTTEAPAAPGPNAGRILVTHSGSGGPSPLPAASAGGVAYVGVWGTSYYASYQPAFVYYNNLAGGSASAVAEAASHEMGHNLGLSHDGTLSGAAYYSGHGSGYVSWAPIMGVGYYANVTQWSKGEYPDANQPQDDVAIIAGKLALRPDDRVDAPSPAATPLAVDGAGRVFASNPESDPDNLEPDNKGALETRQDVDVYAFSAGAGTVSLEVAPAWKAFYRTANRGANADLRATLLDIGGNVLASSDPTTDTAAVVSATVQPGTYFLQVEGIGHPTNYSDYGSEGEYFINGSVPRDGGDVTPPSPDPMAFAAAPAATGPDSITMRAAAASDASGTVEYRFACTAGGAGCTHGDWQASPDYTASGLAANTRYEFAVQARDLAGNTTAWSAGAAATTPAANAAPVAAFSVACSYLSCTFTDASGDGDGVIGAWQWRFGDGATASSRNPAHTYAGAGIYTVELTVTDDRGAQTTALQTISVDAPPAPATPDGLTATDNRNGTARLAWRDASSTETAFELQRETWNSRTRSWRASTTLAVPIAGDASSGETETFVDNSGAGTHHYRVRASGGGNFSAWSAWVQVSVTTACTSRKCR